jgi:hypothetical protein
MFLSRLLILISLWLVGPVLHALPTGRGVFEMHSPAHQRNIEIHYYLPENYSPSTPPVMVFHGMKRNADFYRDSWIDLADEFGFLVLTPLFSEELFPGTTGYNLGNLFTSEEPIAPPTPAATWSYAVPQAVFLHARNVLGLTTAAGYMAFGHSAGSQFLHRLMALHPDPHLLLAIPSNAGWYTLPDPNVSWPYGYKGTALPEKNLATMLNIPTVVLLGDEDTRTDSNGLRRTPEAMAQGPHRFSRGQFFFAQVEALAVSLETNHQWRMQFVRGVGHDGDRMAPHAARIMLAFITPPLDP